MKPYFLLFGVFFSFCCWNAHAESPKSWKLLAGDNSTGVCNTILHYAKESKEPLPQIDQNPLNYPPLAGNDMIRQNAPARDIVTLSMRWQDGLHIVQDAVPAKAVEISIGGDKFRYSLIIQNHGFYRTEQAFYLAALDPKDSLTAPFGSSDGLGLACVAPSKNYDDIPDDVPCIPFQRINMNKALDDASSVFKKEALLALPSSSFFGNGMPSGLVGWPVVLKSGDNERSYLIVSSSIYWQNAPDSPALLVKEPTQEPLVIAFAIEAERHVGNHDEPKLNPTCLFALQEDAK